MYQPTLGRFLSRDPLSENGVDVLTDTGFYAERLTAMRANPWYYGGNRENPYVYVNSDPVNRIDPSGLSCSCQNPPVDPCEAGAAGAKPDPKCAKNQNGGGGHRRRWDPISYGNYCGPGNNGKVPKDPLDACCCSHDACYGTAPAICFSEGFGLGILKCDATFCGCLRKVDCSQTYPPGQDRQDCENYRKLAITTSCGKVLGVIIRIGSGPVLCKASYPENE